MTGWHKSSNMPTMTSKTNPNKPLYGRKLAARRVELGISQDEVEILTDGKIYKSLLWRLENGKKASDSLTWTETEALAKALELSTYELNKILGVKQSEAPKTIFAQADTSVKALYVGKINGGLKTMLAAGEESVFVSIPGWIGDRYKLEEIFVATVAGDSMADDEVRDSLPEGTECYFHRSIHPELNDIVAVWLEHHDIGVLKCFKPESE